MRSRVFRSKLSMIAMEEICYILVWPWLLHALHIPFFSFRLFLPHLLSFEYSSKFIIAWGLQNCY